MSSDCIMHSFANTHISAHPFKGLTETADTFFGAWNNTTRPWQYLVTDLFTRYSRSRSFHSQTSDLLSALEAVDQDEKVRAALIQRSLPAPSLQWCP